MEICIRKILDSNADGVHIEFSSDYGHAEGIWKGHVPELGKSYYVEFDIDEILTWGKDITESNCKEFKIWDEDSQVFLNVKRLSHALDNCTTVRFGNGLILLETNGTPVTTSNYVKIQSQELLVFPYNP